MTIDEVKSIGDIVAVGITVGVIIKVITVTAALFSIVWTGMRIHEMITGRPFHESKLARWLVGKK